MIPTSLPAATIGVTAGTVSLWPSIVRLTSGIDERGLDGADVVQAVLLVFVMEVPHRGLDDPTGGVAETAETAAVLEAVGDALEDPKLDLRALAGEDAFVRAHSPVAADAAGRALAAGLKRVEAQQARRGFDHAVGVVHDDDSARPAHRSERLEAVEVGRRVEHRGGEDLGRRAARPEHLDLPPGHGAASQLFDDVAIRDADLDFVVARLLDVAADSDHARALRLLGAPLGVLRAALTHDPGHRRQRFDVVDGGGHAPPAVHGRKRRARAPLRTPS